MFVATLKFVATLVFKYNFPKKPHPSSTVSHEPPPPRLTMAPDIKYPAIGAQYLKITKRACKQIQELSVLLPRQSLSFDLKSIHSIRTHSCLVRFSAALAVLRSHLSYVYLGLYESGFEDEDCLMQVVFFQISRFWSLDKDSIFKFFQFNKLKNQ